MILLSCFYLGNTFKWISLQVEIVNKWLPDRVVLCFFSCPYRETEHKLNHSAAKKKKKKVIQPHLYLSSRYSMLMLLYELIVRSFLKRSIIYKNIYVLKGANQPQAGHVTGHADLKSYQIF